MGILNGSNIGILSVVLVALPIVLIALIVLILILRARGKARASMKWTRTPARVLASSIEQRTSTDSEGSTSTNYHSVIVYEYVANGQRYRSSRIGFGGDIGYGDSARAQVIANQYPVGGLIDAYYDPSDPAEAVLNRKLGGSNMAVGCVVGLIVVVLLCTGVFIFAGQGLWNQFTNLLPK